MIVRKTNIEDLVVIEPKVFGDNRGYFFESYSKSSFNDNNLIYNFIQDNEAKSSYGVLRGLHYQNPPFTQSKLIRVIHGSIIDVAVDLRVNAKSYGNVFTVELSSENKKQLLVPKGFAHGYVVCSEEAIVSYKVDEVYNPDFENGIIWNDDFLKIDWKLPVEKIILSEKDKKLQCFKNLNSPFI